MATKSIYKDVRIKSRPACRSLVNALEKAKRFPGKDVQLQKKCREIFGEDIKKLFEHEDK